MNVMDIEYQLDVIITSESGEEEEHNVESVIWRRSDPGTWEDRRADAVHRFSSEVEEAREMIRADQSINSIEIRLYSFGEYMRIFKEKTLYRWGEI